MKHCKDCKHFNTSDAYEKHIGWCELQLPPWLYQALNVDKYEVSKTVRTDDTCSFVETWK